VGRRWKGRTGNNVWSFTLTVDEQRGLVYMPVSGPGMNYYGGDRPGNILFSNTTVVLDAQTGRPRCRRHGNGGEGVEHIQRAALPGGIALWQAAQLPR